MQMWSTSPGVRVFKCKSLLNMALFGKNWSRHWSLNRGRCHKAGIQWRKLDESDGANMPDLYQEIFESGADDTIKHTHDPAASPTWLLMLLRRAAASFLCIIDLQRRPGQGGYIRGPFNILVEAQPTMCHSLKVCKFKPPHHLSSLFSLFPFLSLRLSSCECVPAP